ncbi:MAG: peptidoglycan DD-metalloendopeptidase family protein [Cytophagaceae bacterium]
MVFDKSRLFYTFIVTLIVCCSAVAQTPEKKNKDFSKIKTPAIDYSVPDADNILFEEEFSDSIENNNVFFDPRKELELVSEDTTSEDEGELSIVEVSEQLKVDSIWVTIAEYFAIWDSRSVNPYKIDGAKFKDTLLINLYDTLAGLGWSMPLTGCHVTSEFGMRHSRWHYGTDLKLQVGDPVLAAFDGIVRINRFDKQGYGYYIMLRHYNGLETLYGHLVKPSDLKVGQLVRAGDVIGLGGSTGRSTGPHLHFEVRYEGNAIDPHDVYDFPNNTLKYGKVFELNPSHFEYLKVARQVFYHKVRSGETLSTISKKYRVPIATICRLNGISTKTTLKVGRRLRIR